MIIGKTLKEQLKEQLKEIDDKMRILKENNLTETIAFYSLINSRVIIREKLANQILKQQ